jgi:hypothetical protein
MPNKRVKIISEDGQEFFLAQGLVIEVHKMELKNNRAHFTAVLQLNEVRRGSDLFNFLNEKMAAWEEVELKILV